MHVQQEESDKILENTSQNLFPNKNTILNLVNEVWKIGMTWNQNVKWIKSKLV
jgi:hypothetical protein